MNKLITIDLGKLDQEKPVGLVIAENGELALEAESELNKILETQALIEKILEYVKERLGEEMGKRNLIKIKGSGITIAKRAYGTRYSLQNGVGSDFIQQVIYDKPNTEKIDEYVAAKGELPKGVTLKDREEKVSIIRKDEE